MLQQAQPRLRLSFLVQALLALAARTRIWRTCQARRNRCNLATPFSALGPHLQQHTVFLQAGKR